MSTTRAHLIAALEAARLEVCPYVGQLTCDCKYGLIPVVGQIAFTKAMQCQHHLCEHTGCPELRDMLRTLRKLERESTTQSEEG